jgi:hypothetical protein
MQGSRLADGGQALSRDSLEFNRADANDKVNFYEQL